MSRWHWTVLLLAVWLALACAGADAAQRALLVGVSELPQQPVENWLHAPRNDVQLMRQSLLASGWNSSQVNVLADGVPGAGLPDAPGIHQALQRLLDESRSGDFVLLYFSGHGTRVRDTGKSYLEPDGLAEVFLARDARSLSARAGELAGSVRDVEFNRWIQAFLTKNVFIWAVFDSCSATSMTRGAARATDRLAKEEDDDVVRFRGLRREAIRASEPTAAMAPTLPAAPPPVPRARYVAFFASESHQVTPELKLPRKTTGARPHGLLTWSIAQSLAQKPATWRQLFNCVLSLYAPVIAELEQRFPERELPSPVAEGALDAPLFSNAEAIAWTLPAWPAQRQGAALSLLRGAVDGLQAQQPLQVTAVLETGRVISAPAAVGTLQLTASRIDLPPALAAVPGDAVWTVTPQSAPAAFALRVQAPAEAIHGLSLEYPTSVLPTDSGEADIRISAAASGYRATAADGHSVVLPSAEAVRAYVQGRASLKWMERLNQLTASVQLPGLQFALQSLAPDGAVRQREALKPLPTLRPGADAPRIAVEVVNTSGQSVDLLLLGVAPSGQLLPVFPLTLGETNRFESGGPSNPARKRFELPAAVTAPGGRLLALATPARPRSPQRLYGLSPAAAGDGEVRLRGSASSGDERALAVLARW